MTLHAYCFDQNQKGHSQHMDLFGWFSKSSRWAVTQAFQTLTSKLYVPSSHGGKEKLPWIFTEVCFVKWCFVVCLHINSLLSCLLPSLSCFMNFWQQLTNATPSICFQIHSKKRMPCMLIFLLSQYTKNENMHGSNQKVKLNKLFICCCNYLMSFCMCYFPPKCSCVYSFSHVSKYSAMIRGWIRTYIL